MKRRVKGEGSWDTVVIKGKEYIRFRKKYDGMSSKKTFYGLTKKEVRSKVEKFETDYHLKSRTEIAKITVSDYTLNWLMNVKKVEISCNYYETLRKTLEYQIVNTDVGNMQMGALNSSIIQLFFNELALKYSMSTIKKVNSLLKMVFEYAILQNDISESPLKTCVLPKARNVKVQPKKIDILSDNDMENFSTEIEAVNTVACRINGKPGTPIYRSNNKYILLLILYTGMRVGEALALTWDDYDKESKTLNINKNSVMVKDPDSNEKEIEVIGPTKTKAGIRIIPLPSKAIYALDKLYEHKVGNRICSTSKDTRPSESSLTRTLKRICVNAGLNVVPENFGLHDLRHSYASFQLRHGIDPLVVSELLGHESVEITLTIYAHVLKDQKIKAVKIFDIT